MVAFFGFVGGICLFSGVMLFLKGVRNIKASPRNVHLVFVGLALLVGANNFRLLVQKELAKMPAVGVFKTAQREIEGNPCINGYPINCDDLPDGTYKRLEESEHFAFVMREDENPFEAIIIAVCSNEKIPERFAITRIPEEVKKEIEKMKRKSIRNPFVVTNP